MNNHWWWIVSLLGCVLVIFRNTSFRLLGPDITPLWWGITGVISIFMMVAFWYSLWAAPSFFRVWFLASITLGLMGFGSSVFVFGEQIAAQHLFGVILGLLGCFFLVW